jgi:hypothetical protein
VQTESRAGDFMHAAGSSLAVRSFSATAVAREPALVCSWQTKRPAREWNRRVPPEFLQSRARGCRNRLSAFKVLSKAGLAASPRYACLESTPAGRGSSACVPPGKGPARDYPLGELRENAEVYDRAPRREEKIRNFSAIQACGHDSRAPEGHASQDVRAPPI